MPKTDLSILNQKAEIESKVIRSLPSTVIKKSEAKMQVSPPNFALIQIPNISL